MKKIISLIIAAAIICSLAGICSFAAETTVNLYETCASDDPGSALWLGMNGTSNETSVTVKTLVPFSKIFVAEAWGSDGEHNVTVSIEKDGSVVGTKTITQTQNEGNLTWDFGKSFEPGVYTIKFQTDSNEYYFVLKKILTGDIGESKAMYEAIRFAFSIVFDNAADAYFDLVQDVPDKIYTAAYGSVPSGPNWFAGETSATAADHLVRRAACEFNINQPISSVFTDEFWTSWNPDFNATVEGQCPAHIAIKVFKFSYNYANTIAGTPVAEVVFDSNGDNNANTKFTKEGTNCTVSSNPSLHGISIDFASELPAGQYIIVAEEFANSDLNHYMVLPVTENEADYDKNLTKFFINDEPVDNYAIRYGFTVGRGGQFVALTADSAVPADDPVTPPQTGDMTVVAFAAIAVVALAVVVAFKKRVNA